MVAAGVLDGLASYGYPLLLLASLAEATFLVGLVVPGDLVVVIGGVSAARGLLDLRGVYLVVAAGAVLGSHLSYWLGRWGGPPLVNRWGARFDVRRARIEAIEDFFRHHGAKSVFLAAFVAGMKNLVPAIAGAIGMPSFRFTVYNLLGCIARSALVVGIGYGLGANLDRAVAMVGSLNVWAAAAFTAVVLWFVARRVRLREGLAARSETRRRSREK